MIDLKGYEVWFVTGSQHLYGPKTLRRSLHIQRRSRRRWVLRRMCL